jgi:hypothetical protein
VGAYRVIILTSIACSVAMVGLVVLFVFDFEVLALCVCVLVYLFVCVCVYQPSFARLACSSFVACVY